MVRRLIVHCLRPLSLLVAIVSLAVIAQQCEEPRAEAVPPLQSSQTRTVDWYYWLDTGYPQIQRARLDGSGVAETVVSSSEMSTTSDFAWIRAATTSTGSTTATTRSAESPPTARAAWKPW